MKQIKSLFLIALLFFFYGLQAQNIKINNTGNYSQDSLRKLLNDTGKIMLCFESWFNNEDIKIESADSIIFKQQISTNEKLGVAKRLFFKKKLLPINIFIGKKSYTLANGSFKYIYISNQHNKLSFEYSKVYRLYK